MYNLLTEPVIRIQKTGQRETCSVALPELLALAVLDQIENLPGLRWHQMPALHSLLAQLGAAGLLQQGITELPTDPALWRSVLADLSGDTTAWDLAGEEWDAPAFLQPAAGTADPQKAYKKVVQTPDDLDPIYSTKAHDIKPSLDQVGMLDSWLYALINLQTAQSFAGSRLYGISRMCDRTSARPAVSFTPSLRFGAHLARDITALLESTPDNNEGKPQLVWTLPWSGAREEALDPQGLGPLYIDTCRRVRLIVTEGRLSARYATSQGDRIKVGGDTGDPWAPFNLKREQPLKVPPGGFTWYRLCNYLGLAEWRWPDLFHLTHSERNYPQPGHIIARSYCRTQVGKIDGYYCYLIPLTRETVATLGNLDGEAWFRATVIQWRDATNQVRQALRAAVGAAVGATPKFKAAYLSYYVGALEPWIEARFWIRMQTVSLGEWQEELAEEVKRFLESLQGSLPTNSASRRPAQLEANSMLFARLDRLTYIKPKESIA